MKKSYLILVPVLLLSSQADTAEKMPQLSDEQTSALVSIAQASATAVFCREYYSLNLFGVKDLQLRTGIADSPALIQLVAQLTNDFLASFRKMKKKERFANTTCRVLWRQDRKKNELLTCNLIWNGIIQPVCE